MLRNKIRIEKIQKDTFSVHRPIDDECIGYVAHSSLEDKWLLFNEKGNRIETGKFDFRSTAVRALINLCQK